MCIKLVIWKSLYYDARSEKHQIILTKCYTGDRNKRNGIGWACGTYGNGRGAYLKAIDNLEDLGVDGSIILK